VAVAGLSKGLLAAIVVLAVLLLDNQIEAHVLQPFVVGRYVRIHPLAVVLALGTGAVLFGIFGAIVAVPVVACVNSAVRAVLQSRDQPSEGDLIPSTG
jgi:putative heme transporter